MEKACVEQPGLRERFPAILVAVEETDSKIPENPLNGNALQSLAAALAAVPENESRARIGNYKLLRKIGEGGFGCRLDGGAAGADPAARRGEDHQDRMDTEEAIARFKAERQALALMEHPNLARVFDAGIARNRQCIASGRAWGEFIGKQILAWRATAASRVSHLCRAPPRPATGAPPERRWPPP